MPKVRNTIKMQLLQGKTIEDLLAQGYNPQSVRRAKHELENGIGVGSGKKRNKITDIEDFDSILQSRTESTTKQYEDLAIAIISKAVIDLAECYVSQAQKRKGLKSQNTGTDGRINTSEKWFYTEAVNLTNVPPEVLIQAARQRAKERIDGTHVAKRYRYAWVSRDSYTTTKDYRKEQKKNG